jgi:hypothetical protein
VISANKKTNGSTVFGQSSAKIPANTEIKKIMSQDRRNDYDVTNTVQVSNPAAVRDAVPARESNLAP